VLGAGSWGTTLADLLARKDQSVRLWAYEPEVVDAINRTHENPFYLPGFALAPSLIACADACEAVSGAETLVSVSPSHAVRAVVRRVANAVAPGTLAGSATKGIACEALA